MQQDYSEFGARYRAEQTARQAAYTALCQHLEHAPDAQLLSDHTAVLLFALAPEQREDALRMVRGQLYSRNLRDTGRVDSWLADCAARLQEDKEGFLARAEEQQFQAEQAEEKRQQRARREAGRQKPRIRPASSFAPEVARYLVEPYLPRGMVSILGGVSGAGKTSLALDVCAKLTRGAPSAACDDGREHRATIFYLTAENDPNKVLRPRAEAMGADLEHLYFQDGASYAMGDAELYELCRTCKPDLLVFDPIQSYLGQGVQMNRAEQVRPLLDSLGALAKELDMAVLLISHMSKPGPGVCSALDRLLGSSDFRNAARSIVIVGKDPADPGTRVFAHAKNSLGVPGVSQRYHICDNGTVAYDGPCDLTADRIIQEAGGGQRPIRPAATLNAAVEALDKQLGFVGWVEVGEVYHRCAKKGFSERTMRNARLELGLKVLRLGAKENLKYYWFRPELAAEQVAAEINNLNQRRAIPNS